MNTILKEKRNIIILYAWEKLKAEITMEQLGEMFDLKAAQVYRIIKRYCTIWNN